jgi:hypothetical protein
MGFCEHGTSVYWQASYTQAMRRNNVTKTAALVLIGAAAMAQIPDNKRRLEETKGAALKKPDVDLPTVYASVTVSAKQEEATMTRLPSATFSKTLFSRDDQIFHVLDSGINAGQHEGGGKSLEIRRFGFNLDHGGVSGGLKVLVDNIGQNQSTQGHGQGYLGSLKSLSPELAEEVTIINGPFSPEYGDFSGLGVVHIRQRESLSDTLAVRMQGGSFHTLRGFAAVSPRLRQGDALAAYDGSSSDGPFIEPLSYRRDNLTSAWSHHINENGKFGFRFNGGLSRFYSSGQIPLDEVDAGRLDRFGIIDRSNGGRARLGTASGYWSRTGAKGDELRLDGFVSRSLFDLYSNFTFFLNDPQKGDGIQQHDSRLQQGLNAHYQRPHRVAGGWQALLAAGGNFHDNQINVGLFQQMDRVPFATTLGANAHVTNGAGYAQESVSGFSGRLTLSGGMRFDEFRFAVTDRVHPSGTGAQTGGRWQPKAALNYRPSHRAPLLLHINYGRGISTADARVIVQHPENPRISTTGFYEAGLAHPLGRLTLSESAFLIDRSHEQVYIPDDGTFEFKGRSRAYGFETRLHFALTRLVSLTAGITKVANAFYRGGETRIYADSAPHFAANAAFNVTSWKGWTGSLRLRAINHYRLDGQDASIVASGHTVVDLGVSRPIRRNLDFSLAIDNIMSRDYYETQNYFESRLPGEDPAYRIHATPGYPRTIAAGLTFRLGGK